MEKNKSGHYTQWAVSLAALGATTAYFGIVKVRQDQLITAQPIEFTVSMLRAMGCTELKPGDEKRLPDMGCKVLKPGDEKRLSKACNDKNLMPISARRSDSNYLFKCDTLSVFITDQTRLIPPQLTPYRNKSNLRK